MRSDVKFWMGVVVCSVALALMLITVVAPVDPESMDPISYRPWPARETATYGNRLTTFIPTSGGLEAVSTTTTTGISGRVLSSSGTSNVILGTGASTEDGAAGTPAVSAPCPNQVPEKPEHPPDVGAYIICDRYTRKADGSYPLHCLDSDGVWRERQDR